MPAFQVDKIANLFYTGLVKRLKQRLYHVYISMRVQPCIIDLGSEVLFDFLNDYLQCLDILVYLTEVFVRLLRFIF